MKVGLSSLGPVPTVLLVLGSYSRLESSVASTLLVVGVGVGDLRHPSSGVLWWGTSVSHHLGNDDRRLWGSLVQTPLRTWTKVKEKTVSRQHELSVKQR